MTAMRAVLLAACISGCAGTTTQTSTTTPQPRELVVEEATLVEARRAVGRTLIPELPRPLQANSDLFQRGWKTASRTTCRRRPFSFPGR